MKYEADGKITYTLTGGNNERGYLRKIMRAVK